MGVQLSPSAEGFTLSGRLDNQRTHELYRTLPDADAAAIELDLSQLERIDSAGLALLVLWSNRQRSAGGKLQLIHIPQQAKQMIDILGLDEALQV